MPAEDFIQRLSVGLLETNCYLVRPENSGILFIVDPGGAPEQIADAAEAMEDCEKRVILLTHAHVDHISGIPLLMERLNISGVYLPPGDQFLYRSPENAILPYIPAAENLPDVKWPPAFPGIECIPCPGHTPGGVSYFFQSMNAIFTGDTLFRASVGRTDLPGGDSDALMSSIRENLMSLPDSLIVYPGHGPATTIGEERRQNPYLFNSFGD